MYRGMQRNNAFVDNAKTDDDDSTHLTVFTCSMTKIFNCDASLGGLSWITHTGATSHMTSDGSEFVSHEPASNRTAGSGTTARAEAVGNGGSSGVQNVCEWLSAAYEVSKYLTSSVRWRRITHLLITLKNDADNWSDQTFFMYLMGKIYNSAPL